MADFASVLRRTIDALDDNTPVMREKIYEKARATIESKLQAIMPPPPAIVIERQRKALENAITAVRADFESSFDDPVDPFAELTRIMGHNPRSPSEPTPVHIAPEPSIQDGPRYGLVGGKLSVAASTPTRDEAALQGRLHARLRKSLTEAEDLLGRIANRHPEMVGAFREYSSLLRADTGDIDVVSVWAVGGSLLSFSDSYRAQNESRTTSEPLEPAAEALLTGVGRMHGAFIMGFEEGRDLVERADAFAAEGGVPLDAREATRDLLEVLSTDADLVTVETRRLTATARDALDELGWSAGRVSFSAYLIVRNSLHAIVKHTVGVQGWISGAIGTAVGSSVLAGDPELQFLRASVPMLRDYGVQILAFTKHSPEMRAYVEWSLSVLKLDYQQRE